MAFDQVTRNRLQRLVSDCRKTLTDEFTLQLQQDYGLDPRTGEVTELSRLTHLTDRERHTAALLRETLAHYLAGEGESKAQRQAAIDRIIREQAFTVLNRLAALLMMEARGLLRESVSKGVQSQSFELYRHLAGTALGETGEAYQTFLFSLFDEFAIDLPALFDRFAPQGRLFPRETALNALLDLLNYHEIEPLWALDETIGWIYQYFNSQEERKAMRKASQAPRNSRELAVRNQFFTPRYVVEFLVDNTLGRQWFNATGGITPLRDSCQYLLVKPDEQPEVGIKLRDPRTLKLLDPACGSMHFGLYAFDLFLQIYRDAWQWEQQHGPGSLDLSTQLEAGFEPLYHTYADEEALLRDVPRLIIEHNIYGVDIDPRAAQIASLALWLRAQRAWHEAGVPALERPDVGQGNVIAAVAPPAEKELREAFAACLDRQDAELFEKTLQMLKGLPELGVLLRAEKELPALIRQVYVGKGRDLFAEQEQETWQQAEERLRRALLEFSEEAGATYQSRLFAQDVLQGLRMIDLCRVVFDVVVMNPPFGDPSEGTKKYLEASYKNYNKNVLCGFVLRSWDLLRDGGSLAVVYDRTAVVKKTYEKFRREILSGLYRFESHSDLGWGVLDANVEVCCTTLNKNGDKPGCDFFDLRNSPVLEKSCELARLVSEFRVGEFSYAQKRVDPDVFLEFPNCVIGYDFPDFVINSFQKRKSLKSSGVRVIAGHTMAAERFFRYWWEVLGGNCFKDNEVWQRFYNGGVYNRYISHLSEVVRYDFDGGELEFHKSTIFRNLKHHMKGGAGFGKRGDIIDAHILPKGFVSSVEGQAVLIEDNVDPYVFLGLMNSKIFQAVINLWCGQHKYPGYVHMFPAPDWESPKMEEVGRLASKAFLLKLRYESCDETSPLFFCADSKKFWDFSFVEEVALDREILCDIEETIDNILYDEFELSACDIDFVEKAVGAFPSTGGVIDNNEKEFWACNLTSFLVGAFFGRWSIDHIQSEKLLNIGSDLYFPARPPAMKIKNKVGGGVVDDVGLVKGVREKLDYLVSEYGSSVDENLICRCLGSDGFGHLLGGSEIFFTYHIAQYSKSRKEAPIYWPLATASGSYTLWFYYPDLTDQTLFTAANDFVEPKLNRVRSELDGLRFQGSGRSRADEKHFEELSGFRDELADLRDTLLRIAPSYKPNHDDGVQITAAPLWSLFRHKPWQKVLKETWEKLEQGDYDWAHLAMAYWPERVREKCVTDKSLAIAHDLEHLYVEPELAPKKTRGRKKSTGSSE